MSSKQVRWTPLTEGKTHRFLKSQISSTIRYELRYGFVPSPSPFPEHWSSGLQRNGLDGMQDLWSVHEEERIAFEIKTELVAVEGAGTS